MTERSLQSPLPLSAAASSWASAHRSRSPALRPCWRTARCGCDGLGLPLAGLGLPLAPSPPAAAPTGMRQGMVGRPCCPDCTYVVAYVCAGGHVYQSGGGALVHEAFEGSRGRRHGIWGLAAGRALPLRGRGRGRGVGGGRGRDRVRGLLGGPHSGSSVGLTSAVLRGCRIEGRVGELLLLPHALPRPRPQAHRDHGRSVHVRGTRTRARPAGGHLLLPGLIDSGAHRQQRGGGPTHDVRWRRPGARGVHRGRGRSEGRCHSRGPRCGGWDTFSG
jgi:hypothetical protein